MKTPEEIKKGLERCPGDPGCDHCMMASTCNIEADALAYIQRLEAQVPKWISVEESMPESSDLVLVVANGKPRENIELRNAILIASYWADEGWIADEFEGWDGLIVSHWMPLPEPPKED